MALEVLKDKFERLYVSVDIPDSNVDQLVCFLILPVCDH